MDLSLSTIEVLLVRLFVLVVLIVCPCLVYRWLHKGKKLPKWLSLANAVSILPVIAAPFVAFASIWISMLFQGWEYVILVVINSYSIVLVAMVFLSARIYRKYQSTGRALLPLVPSLIAYCALLALFICVFVVKQ